MIVAVTKKEPQAISAPLHISNAYVLFLSTVAALGGVLFGFDTAIISGTIPSLKTYFHLNEVALGWAVSSILIGCGVGAMMAGKVADILGRKKTMAICAFLFATTGIGVAMASSFSVFVTFRMTGGLAVGAAAMVVPMYIAETVPASLRGRMVALYQLAIVLGILLAYVVNYALAGVGENDWRWMFGSQALPAGLFFFLLFFVPDSPRWLVQKGGTATAHQVLAKTGGKSYADTELEAIMASLAMLTNGSVFSQSISGISKKNVRPLAKAMCEFSWLERRWPVGSYGDWDKVLDELTVSGYDAIRIEAYPHLIAEDPSKEWTVLPVWDHYDGGSPAMIKVRIQPSLTDLISKCKKHKVKVGLSTWYREDVDNTSLKVDSPEKMAANWLEVLQIIGEKDLMDTILYVDLCNEWPGDVWTPFFKSERKGHNWSIPASIDWMKKAMDIVHEKYPQLPFTFSFDHYQAGILQEHPTPYLDFIEQHIWMASLSRGEFNNKRPPLNNKT